MEDRTDQELKIRELLISCIKRSKEDIVFIENVAKRTSKSVDSISDFALQCRLVQNQLQVLLDYNFYPEEIERVEPYQVEVKFLEA